MHIAHSCPMLTLPSAWDASIDLTAACIGPGEVSEKVIHCVRAAVAGTAWGAPCQRGGHQSVPATLSWISVYCPGSAELMSGPGWDKVRRGAEAAVRSVTIFSLTAKTELPILP